MNEKRLAVSGQVKRTLPLVGFHFIIDGDVHLQLLQI